MLLELGQKIFERYKVVDDMNVEPVNWRATRQYTAIHRHASSRRLVLIRALALSPRLKFPRGGPYRWHCHLPRLIRTVVFDRESPIARC
jgi:hypothetical protein